MEQELPGLTQLLVEQHVKEVVDEVACEQKTANDSGFSSKFIPLFHNENNKNIKNIENEATRDPFG